MTPRDLVLEILGEGYYYNTGKQCYVWQESITGEPLDEITISVALKNIEPAISTLEEREICILRKRYFEGLTIEASGKKIVNLRANPCDGVSVERARQIIRKAIRKLKHPMRLKILLWGQ